MARASKNAPSRCARNDSACSNVSSTLKHGISANSASRIEGLRQWSSWEWTALTGSPEGERVGRSESISAVITSGSTAGSAFCGRQLYGGRHRNLERV